MKYASRLWKNELHRNNAHKRRSTKIFKNSYRHKTDP